jgi:hypothetical protein
MEFAIDAPWRLEPIPQASGPHKYGNIPIVIVFHDAIYELSRNSIVTFAADFTPESVVSGNFERLNVGELETIVVREHMTTGPDTDNSETSEIRLSDLVEIERKQWISTKADEPPHEICQPSVANASCARLRRITNSHEWHALFYYQPQFPVQPGRNIHLEVTVTTRNDDDRKAWRNYLVVHAGEDPLPRFSPNWLYGDLHYHSQSSDNEGESAYSYRNVARTLGALGMDFVFATDHASDGSQVDGDLTLGFCDDLTGKRCIPNPTGAGSYTTGCRETCLLKSGAEARDLNSVRFASAKRQLYGPFGANEVVARDAAAIANTPRFLVHRILPQVYMGEEVDAQPAMSASEHRQGFIEYGDRLRYRWPDNNNCIERSNLNACRKKYSSDMPSNNLSVADQRSYLVLDEQGIPTEEKISENLDPKFAALANYYVVPDKTSPLPSRQHLVYFPVSTRLNSQGWVSSATGKYGGATKTLDQILKQIVGNGFTFLAHPLENEGPGGPGPDIVPYSRKALDTAWESRAVLGLQLWNENPRKATSPSDLTPIVMSILDVDGAKRYAYGLPWNTTATIGKLPYQWRQRVLSTRDRLLYHGTFTWDAYLRKGLDPEQTKRLRWLNKGVPRKWFMAGGSDAHGDFNFRRHGRPCLDRWCDFPVDDTAIGKPRNLVFGGEPRGPVVVTRPETHRFSNVDVINGLRSGKFMVTDGPAIRIAVDRNRSGIVDRGDYEMGSHFNLHPGEHVPVLVEWQSTLEFGRLSHIDLYVGTPEETIAPVEAGIPGRMNGYSKDPAGVLRINLANQAEDTRLRGTARVFLSPAAFHLRGTTGRMFYLRAYAETTTAGDGRTDCPQEQPGMALIPSDCGNGRAFSNPVWGIYQHNCNRSSIALDADQDSVPDVCESNLPDPCAPTPAVRGRRPLGPTEAAEPPSVAIDPSRPASTLKPAPRTSCTLIG